MFNRKNHRPWLSLVLLTLILLTGKRPVGLGGVQRGQPTTCLRKAPLPAPFDSNPISFTVILSPDEEVATRYDGMIHHNTPEFKAARDKLTEAFNQ